MSRTLLSPAALARDLEVRDLTDPAQGPHAIQLILDQITAALEHAWHCPTRLVRAHPVVPLEDNYERLGYPPDAVTRDARYTRYVSETCVLRSHTSAVIAWALRDLAAARPTDADTLLACPGLCYRRDAVDRLHTGTPHQLDLWRVTDHRPLGEADLTEMIGLVVEAAVPGARWRTVPTGHPYTLDGRQIDVLAGGEWVEVGECGLAAPHVLAAAGLPTTWHGLALGLGLDRLLMLRKGIPDIRLLRSTEPAVAAQLLDLAPYRPVSHQPPVRRDLSLVVGPDTDVTVEALGDRVREALGPDEPAVEAVELLADTAYDDLPPPARERLGLVLGQRNVLVRVVLRALDRTLTDTAANELRDRIYQALHEGPVHEWATTGAKR